MKILHAVGALALLCSVSQTTAAPNVSVRDMACAGWNIDHCPFWGYDEPVKAKSEAGRNIAAAVQYFASYCKKEGFSNLNPFAKDFIKKAKASNPKQFEQMLASFKKEVPKAVLPKFKSSVCKETWTAPFQPGGVAAEAVGVESFYIYEDDEM